MGLLLRALVPLVAPSTLLLDEDFLTLADADDEDDLRTTGP